MKGTRDPPAAAKCGGAVTLVLLASLPLLLLVFFLSNNRAACIAPDTQLWSQQLVKQQSPRPRDASSHDRLLGGLLSPDFDEQACRSRYQGPKRWKPSPFPVSPYLVRKLREYEANHRRCGPDTARYREAMAQLKSGRNGDRGECRYVVLLWVHKQGLGNRMLSLVSTFLYALLTGRVVLMHEPAEVEGLYCEPFPGTSWLLPIDFPYKDCGSWSSCQENYVTMLENNVIGYDDVDASALPAYVYLHLQSDYRDLRLQNHTFCEEDHRALDRFNWMVLRSDVYYAVALFLVPTYRDELDRMFPAKGSVFIHLGRYLLNPGNRAWGVMERFFDGYLAGADERLGVQVRVAPGDNAVPFEVMFEHIERCARENDLLPQVTDQPAGVRPANSTAKPKTKAVLLVSLHPEYYDKLHGTYYSNATVSGEVVTVYQPSHEVHQHSEARGHNERALAEIFLLSYCDELVTSAWSTFGYVAHALAGLRPWLLTPYDWSGRKADAPCVRAESEPCLLSQPSLVCRGGKTDLDPVSHVPFLRHCEDATGFLKLVN